MNSNFDFYMKELLVDIHVITVILQEKAQMLLKNKCDECSKI